MEPETLYCPKCQDPVRTTVDVPRGRSSQANAGNGDLICLDMNEGCRHGECPLSSLSGTVMAVRLARSGLKDEAFETIHAHCEACERTADMKVVEKRLAVCGLCGAPNRWVRLETDRGNIIVTGVTLPS